MLSKKKKIGLYLGMVIVTLLVVFPFAWMIMLSFKDNTEIMLTPLSLPTSLNFDNYSHAFNTLNYGQLYGNTFIICTISIIFELVITFLSSFVLARMEFNRHIRSLVYGYLILGLSISPFILLFPIYRISVLMHITGKARLIFPYVATSISFNTLLLGIFKELAQRN